MHAWNHWSYIFWKKSICMIFGCGDCFTSLIWRYPLFAQGYKVPPEKPQSHLKSQFPPEMALLETQKNFPTRLKSTFLFAPSQLLQKVLKMTRFKLTIGRISMIGIYWYQSTNRFINSQFFMHADKGGLTIELIINYPYENV